MKTGDDMKTERVKHSDVKANDYLKVMDAAFTCMREGDIKPVFTDEHGPYVRCLHEGESDICGCYIEPCEHYLDGQKGDDGFLVGLEKVLL